MLCQTKKTLFEIIFSDQRLYFSKQIVDQLKIKGEKNVPSQLWLSVRISDELILVFDWFVGCLSAASGDLGRIAAELVSM